MRVYAHGPWTAERIVHSRLKTTAAGEMAKKMARNAKAESQQIIVASERRMDAGTGVQVEHRGRCRARG